MSADSASKRTPYDEAFKTLLSHPELIADLLRGFVQEDWLAQLDLSTLEKINSEYISDKLDRRLNDLVWRVRWRERWLYLLIVIELQHRPYKFMPVRMLSYIGLLYEDILKQDEAIRRSGVLPPILPIVFYSGHTKWRYATSFQELYMPDMPAKLLAYQPNLAFF